MFASTLVSFTFCYHHFDTVDKNTDCDSTCIFTEIQHAYESLLTTAPFSLAKAARLSVPSVAVAQPPPAHTTNTMKTPRSSYTAEKPPQHPPTKSSYSNHNHGESNKYVFENNGSGKPSGRSERVRKTSVPRDQNAGPPPAPTRAGDMTNEKLKEFIVKNGVRWIVNYVLSLCE